MTTELPPRPDFDALEAAAVESADRHTVILAMIGNLVLGWSNNESMFIYILMLLMRTDRMSATITFITLNTTRARLDLVQRLARAQIRDRAVAKELDRLIGVFNECTRSRNELNHCMYSVNDRGEITHTHSLRIQDRRGVLQLGEIRPMDEARLEEMRAVIGKLGRLNKDIWDFLPRLRDHMHMV